MTKKWVYHRIKGTWELRLSGDVEELLEVAGVPEVDVSTEEVRRWDLDRKYRFSRGNLTEMSRLSGVGRPKLYRDGYQSSRAWQKTTSADPAPDGRGTSPTSDDTGDVPPPSAALRDVKEWHIRRAYEHHGGIIARAARSLGMDPVSLSRRGLKSRHGGAGNENGRENLKST